MDLCLATFSARPHSGQCASSTLTDTAVKGKCLIPLEAMVKFVRVAHIYEQKDVMELLGEKVIEATQASDDQLMVGRGKALQLMIAMELLVGSQKRILSAKQGVTVTNKRGVSATTRGFSASVGRASMSAGREESAPGRGRMPACPQEGRGGKKEGDGGGGKGGKAVGKADGKSSPQEGRGKGGSPQGGKGGAEKGGSGRKGEGGAGSPKGGKGDGKDSRKSSGKKGAAKEEGDGGAAAEGETEGGGKVNEEPQTS